MEALQVNQSQIFELFVKAPPLRWPERSLTAPFQVLDHTATDEPVHPSYFLTGISKGKIPGPSVQLPINAHYETRHRDMALVTADHLPKPFPFGVHRLARRGHVQIFTSTTFQVPVVSERKSQKIKAGLGLAQIDHLGFVPVNLQTKPGFNLRLDISPYSTPLIPGKYRQVVRIADDLCLGPASRTFGRVEYLLQLVKIRVRPLGGQLPFPAVQHAGVDS